MLSFFGAGRAIARRRRLPLQLLLLLLALLFRYVFFLLSLMFFHLLPQGFSYPNIPSPCPGTSSPSPTAFSPCPDISSPSPTASLPVVALSPYLSSPLTSPRHGRDTEALFLPNLSPDNEIPNLIVPSHLEHSRVKPSHFLSESHQIWSLCAIHRQISVLNRETSPPLSCLGRALTVRRACLPFNRLITSTRPLQLPISTIPHCSASVLLVPEMGRIGFVLILVVSQVNSICFITRPTICKPPKLRIIYVLSCPRLNQYFNVIYLWVWEFRVSLAIIIMCSSSPTILLLDVDDINSDLLPDNFPKLPSCAYLTHLQPASLNSFLCPSCPKPDFNLLRLDYMDFLLLYCRTFSCRCLQTPFISICLDPFHFLQFHGLCTISFVLCVQLLDRMNVL